MNLADLQTFRVVACDLNGQMRGKVVPGSYADKLPTGSVRLPFSALDVDLWGTDIVGSPLVFESGDADGMLFPTDRAPCQSMRPKESAPIRRAARRGAVAVESATTKLSLGVNGDEVVPQLPEFDTSGDRSAIGCTRLAVRLQRLRSRVANSAASTRELKSAMAQPTPARPVTPLV